MFLHVITSCLYNTMTEAVLLSPTFPPQAGGPGMLVGGGGFDRIRKGLLRRTVDYHCSTLRYLEDRKWQRDIRDRPVIQPDTSYFNQILIPRGLEDNPVNAVTTKFVKACTNKVRSPIFCTTWVPDGRRLVTGAASGEFTLWNGVNFNFESIIQAHDCSVRSMNWSHNGKWMVTTDDRGFVKYWQINFNNVHTFQAHNEPVRSSSFSPTDAKLATCSDDGTIRIFDFLSCTEEYLLRGHGADVKCIHWHPTKNLLASGSKDNQQPVKLWDPKMGQSVCTIHAHKATVMDVKWNGNGNWLATASRDHLIKLFDIRTMKELWVLKGHKKDVNTISWHPVHESLFASGGSDGAILFWTVGNGREIGGMESAHEGFVWNLSWHPLGHLLCSGANDHTCKFWCRNRPGEELKDKYNSFHNPFFVGDEMDTSYQLPGMGSGMTHGSVSLPPPSHHTSDAVTLPPPLSNTWKPRTENNDLSSTEQILNSPKRDVPVLGADIIAQTFADRKTFGDHAKTFGDHARTDFGFHGNREPPTELLDPLRMDKSDNSNGIRPPLLGERPPSPHRFPEYNESRIKAEPPGGFGGRPPPPPSGYRGPPPHPPPSDDYGRGRGFNRFSWHNPDFHSRHPSFDEERWGPPGGNPYVYRRSDVPPEEFGENRRLVDGPQRGEEWQTEPRRPSEDFHSPMFHDNQFSRQRDFPGNQFDPPQRDQQWQPSTPQNPLFPNHVHASDRQWSNDHGPNHPHHHKPDVPHSDFPDEVPNQSSHDPRMSTSSDHRGPPLPSVDHRGPLPSDRVLPHSHGPPEPSHDPRGPPPPSHDPRGHPPPSHDPRVPPPPSHDPRVPPPPSHDPRVPPPPSHDPRVPPPPSHDPRGPPPQAHDPRGPPPQVHDPRGPPHDPRGPPPSHDPRGHSFDQRRFHEQRGSQDIRGHPPPPPHDFRGPIDETRRQPHDPRGPPTSSYDNRGPSGDFREYTHDQGRLPPHHMHDQRGPPPPPQNLDVRPLLSQDQRGPPPHHHNPHNEPFHGPTDRHYDSLPNTPSNQNFQTTEYLEPNQQYPSDPRMNQRPLSDQFREHEDRFQQSPQQGYNEFQHHQGYHGNQPPPTTHSDVNRHYQSDGSYHSNESHHSSHGESSGNVRDPRFERRGRGWSNVHPHRGGNEWRDRRSEDRRDMKHEDDRKGDRGRGRGKDNSPPRRKSLSDDKDNPPSKRSRSDDKQSKSSRGTKKK